MANITDKVKTTSLFIKGPTVNNNHSEIDGIGSLTVSLPKNIYFAMFQDPNWGWYFDGDNEAIAKFVKTNPQFSPEFRDNFGNHPPLPINKDGKKLQNVIGYPESFTDNQVAHIKSLKQKIKRGEI